MENPYAPTMVDEPKHVVFGDHARRVRGTFLYREIEISRPAEITLIYSGWWWVQRIQLNGHRVWSRISWKSIHDELDFKIPASIIPTEPKARIEIGFSRSLSIRRFRFWIEDELVYDEVNV